jgi:hypothetical protein
MTTYLCGFIHSVLTFDTHSQESHVVAVTSLIPIFITLTSIGRAHGANANYKLLSSILFIAKGLGPELLYKYFIGIDGVHYLNSDATRKELCTQTKRKPIP